MTNHILRFSDLSEKLHISRSTIYNLIKQDDTFPKPVKLSKRAVGFNSADVDNWLNSRIEESQGGIAA